MRDQDLALSIAQKALSFAHGADQAAVTVTVNRQSYARYARNYVTQNLTSEQTQVSLTYYSAKRSGTTTTWSR